MTPEEMKEADLRGELIRRARMAALEEAAKLAELYADENLTMAGDSILADPSLSGRERPRSANANKSAELAVDGCIHSAMYHASKNIAAAIRALKDALAHREGDRAARMEKLKAWRNREGE